jgi:hypothetical protein
MDPVAVPLEHGHSATIASKALKESNAWQSEDGQEVVDRLQRWSVQNRGAGGLQAKLPDYWPGTPQL